MKESLRRIQIFTSSETAITQYTRIALSEFLVIIFILFVFRRNIYRNEEISLLLHHNIA